LLLGLTLVFLLLRLGLMVLLPALLPSLILFVLAWGLRIGQCGSSSEERKHQKRCIYNFDVLHGLASHT
jgi:hypothetical protein